jgi:hypothetical protein
VVPAVCEEKFQRLWPRMKSRGLSESSRTTMVLLISGFSTDLCDQFSEIGRSMMSSLLDFDFFFFFFFFVCVEEKEMMEFILVQKQCEKIGQGSMIVSS